jgi:hypothetical protein
MKPRTGRSRGAAMQSQNLSGPAYEVLQCKTPKPNRFSSLGKRPPGRIKANVRGCNPQDIISFCVGCLGRKRPDVRHLTESGAQPPTEPALLLLVLPLLLTLQKEAAEPE